MKEGRNNGSRMKERRGKKEKEGEDEGRKGDLSGYLVYKVIQCLHAIYLAQKSHVPHRKDYVSLPVRKQAAWRSRC